jgi:hypothetical protein
MITDLDNYDFKEHTHRFAAWAAARAASTSTFRFKVADGKRWLEASSSLRMCAGEPDRLPTPEQFDDAHEEWCKEIMKAAGNPEKFKHGVAAKLINIYLKAAVICPLSSDQPKVKAVHPPIDRLLLDELARKVGGIWLDQKRSWSKFCFHEYEEVIEKVKVTVGDEAGLWTIEKYWPGNQ